MPPDQTPREIRGADEAHAARVASSGRPGRSERCRDSAGPHCPPGRRAQRAYPSDSSLERLAGDSSALPPGRAWRPAVAG